MEEIRNVRIVIEAKGDNLCIDWTGRDVVEVLGMLEIAKAELTHEALEHLKEQSRNIRIPEGHIDEGPQC